MGKSDNSVDWAQVEEALSDADVILDQAAVGYKRMVADGYNSTDAVVTLVSVLLEEHKRAGDAGTQLLAQIAAVAVRRLAV